MIHLHLHNGQVTTKCTAPVGRSDAPAWKTFWAHVDRKGPQVRGVRGRCWVWTGGKTSRGYGRLMVDAGRRLKAHQYAWELSNGSRKALHVLHRCDVPACVRPSHLFLGTTQDNSEDARRKGRLGKRHTWATVRRWRRAFRAGRESVASFAARHGVTTQTMHEILTNRTWVDATYEAPTEWVKPFGRPTLTRRQVAAVRRALVRGESTRKLAMRFAVSRSTICHIKQGRSWVS